MQCLRCHDCLDWLRPKIRSPSMPIAHVGSSPTGAWMAILNRNGDPNVYLIEGTTYVPNSSSEGPELFVRAARILRTPGHSITSIEERGLGGTISKDEVECLGSSARKRTKAHTKVGHGRTSGSVGVCSFRPPPKRIKERN